MSKKKYILKNTTEEDLNYLYNDSSTPYAVAREDS